MSEAKVVADARLREVVHIYRKLPIGRGFSEVIHEALPHPTTLGE